MSVGYVRKCRDHPRLPVACFVQNGVDMKFVCKVCARASGTKQLRNEIGKLKALYPAFMKEWRAIIRSMAVEASIVGRAMEAMVEECNARCQALYDARSPEHDGLAPIMLVVKTYGEIIYELGEAFSTLVESAIEWQLASDWYAFFEAWQTRKDAIGVALAKMHEVWLPDVFMTEECVLYSSVKTMREKMKELADSQSSFSKYYSSTYKRVDENGNPCITVIVK